MRKKLAELRKTEFLEYNLCEAAGESGEGVAEGLAFEPVRKRLVYPFAFAGNLADDDVGAFVGVVEVIVPAELNRENFAVQEHANVGGAVVRINRDRLDIAEALDQLMVLDKGFNRLVA